jgi:uncharacterized protein
MIMKILIAGATGLVGSALKQSLTGHEVATLSRKKGEGSLYWDPNNGVIQPSALENFDAVINVCGENIASRWSEEKKSKILESRVKTTRLLADTLAHLKNPPQVWINASAVGFYGDRGDTPLTEESPPGTGFLASVCKAWEAATESASKKGIRVVQARFGIVLSPKGGLLKRLLTPFKMGLGGQVGDGKQYMSWIAIDDLVAMIAFLLDHEEIAGPVNIVSPNPVTNGEFTQAFGRQLHRPSFCTLPAPIAKLLFGKEMAEEMLLASTRAMPEKIVESGYQFRYPKLEDALAEFCKI